MMNLKPICSNAKTPKAYILNVGGIALAVENGFMPRAAL